MSVPSSVPVSLPMSMSDACRRRITQPSEGLRLESYRDCAGVWTIGYGHTSGAGAPEVSPGMQISADEAEAILACDLQMFERGVARLVADAQGGVAQREFDALVDLAFNIGLPAFKSSSLLQAYRAGDKATAARKFLDWNRAGGRIAPGLVARRESERVWFLTGGLPDDPPLPPDEPATGSAGAPADPYYAALPAAVLAHLEGAHVMKGYRTLAVGFVLAIGPAALQYLGAVDWAEVIGPTGAFFVSGVIAVVMRLLTSTPVGKQGAAEQP